MRILVGVDGSGQGRQALEEALEDASEPDASLTVALYGPDDEAAVEKWVRDRLATAGVEVTIREFEGDPGGRLVELAETEGFDRIVLPGGTRSPLGKIQFDRATEFVLMNAHTSVTLAR